MLPCKTCFIYFSLQFSQKHAFGFAFLGGLFNGGSYRLVQYFHVTSLLQSRAFDVLYGTNFSRQFLAFLVSYLLGWALAVALPALFTTLCITEIQLRTDKNDGSSGSQLFDLLVPPAFGVSERFQIGDGKTQTKHVGFGVISLPDSIFTLLAFRVPKLQLINFAVDIDVRNVGARE